MVIQEVSNQINPPWADGHAEGAFTSTCTVHRFEFGMSQGGRRDHGMDWKGWMGWAVE